MERRACRQPRMVAAVGGSVAGMDNARVLVVGGHGKVALLLLPLLRMAMLLKTRRSRLWVLARKAG